MITRLVRLTAVTLMVSLLLIPVVARAADTPSEKSITITSPVEGSSVSNENLQVTGTAPANTIVTVTILDTDTNRSEITHQSYGGVEGTVTTDGKGRWAFVPQQQLVPGQFSVQASYQSDTGETVSSTKINFVAVDASGASAIISKNLIQLLIIPAILVAIIIIAIALFIVRQLYRKRKYGIDPGWAYGLLPQRWSRKHRQASAHAHEGGEHKPLFVATAEGQEYLKDLSDETEHVEDVLATTAEELEQAHEELETLRDRLDATPASKTKSSGPPPAAPDKELQKAFEQPPFGNNNKDQ